MNELIYRCDCDLFSPLLGTEEIVHDLMSKYSFTWEDNLNDNNFDEDKIYNFAIELLQMAQKVIDTAPTITTDEVLAYKCPECRVISILYDPMEKKCPNCGIERRLNY